MSSIKGYKAFNKDLKCREVQFKVGNTFEVTGKLEMCSNGFHFCENILDVYNYYDKSGETRIWELR